MQATHELTGLGQKLRNRLQGIVGSRHRLGAIPDRTGRTNQRIEQPRISGPLHDLFQFVRGWPATVVGMVQLLLQGIHLEPHVESQPGNTSVIITTRAIERLPQCENRTCARQKINPAHNRKSSVYGLVIGSCKTYPTTTTCVLCLACCAGMACGNSRPAELVREATGRRE
ncbi:hypothetical protein D3C80_1574570 [compost metagenome]